MPTVQPAGIAGIAFPAERPPHRSRTSCGPPVTRIEDAQRCRRAYREPPPPPPLPATITDPIVTTARHLQI